eukprot:3940333-Rhodomonas_salina.1
MPSTSRSSPAKNRPWYHLSFRSVPVQLRLVPFAAISTSAGWCHQYNSARHLVLKEAPDLDGLALHALHVHACGPAHRVQLRPDETRADQIKSNQMRPERVGSRKGGRGGPNEG